MNYFESTITRKEYILWLLFLYLYLPRFFVAFENRGKRGTKTNILFCLYICELKLYIGEIDTLLQI